MTAMARTVSCALMIFSLAGVALAQEKPYFVTYDDHLEKRGELELALLTVTGAVRDEGTRYAAPWLELEYGVLPRWTTELYLEGVTFRRDGSAFTGWRWENRFRPLKDDHAVNPVLYFEYEHVSEASRIQKEIVGRGPLPFGPVSELADERSHELEGRLILSSHFRRWNVSENIVVEKNLSEDEGFEFGYAVGMAKVLGEPEGACRFCAGAFTAALEVYGGLGTTGAGATGATRQFVAPVFNWRVTPGSQLKASAGFGMTSASDRFILRVGYTFDLD